MGKHRYVFFLFVFLIRYNRLFPIYVILHDCIVSTSLYGCTVIS